MSKKYVEIEVDGLLVPVTTEEANDPNIADKVRAARESLRLLNEFEAEDYDSAVGDDTDGMG